MMDTAVIIRAFSQLRGMCDPRGHDLLDAIEATLIDSLQAVDNLDTLCRRSIAVASAPNVVATGGPGIRVVNGEPRYSSDWLNDDRRVNP